MDLNLYIKKGLPNLPLRSGISAKTGPSGETNLIQTDNTNMIGENRTIPTRAPRISNNLFVISYKVIPCFYSILYFDFTNEFNLSTNTFLLNLIARSRHSTGSN